MISVITRAASRWRRLAWPVLAFAVVSCADDCTPSGALTFSEESVTFEAEEGGANPAPRVIEITSSTTKPIIDLTAVPDYGTSQPEGWLTSVLSQPSTPSDLTITAQTGTLAPGTYTANVVVSGINASNKARNIPVTFRVGDLIGASTELPNSGDINANTLIGQLIAVPSASVLGSVNLYVKAPLTAGSQVKIGVYPDAGGQPGTLIAASAATPLVLGRTQIPLTASLPAGSYWIMMVFNNSVNVGIATTTVTTKFLNHAFANALPGTLPTHATDPAPAVNMFLKVFEP